VARLAVAGHGGTGQGIAGRGSTARTGERGRRLEPGRGRQPEMQRRSSLEHGVRSGAREAPRAQGVQDLVLGRAEEVGEEMKGGGRGLNRGGGGGSRLGGGSACHGGRRRREEGRRQ
jgi:hypothetical protein